MAISVDQRSLGPFGIHEISREAAVKGHLLLRRVKHIVLWVQRITQTLDGPIGM